MQLGSARALRSRALRSAPTYNLQVHPTDRVFRVEVFPRQAQPTPLERRRLYFLRGQNLTAAQIEHICRTVLADPVADCFAFGTADWADPAGSAHSIDVTYLPGVTDTAAEQLVHALHTLGHTHISQAATGTRVLLRGEYSPDQVLVLARDFYCNDVVQRFTIDTPIQPVFVDDQAAADDRVETITLRGASDEALVAISKSRRLALDLAEMQAIRAYYDTEGRDPSDVELEMLAQTWSEHCVHKTFKARIDFDADNHTGTGTGAGTDATRTTIKGLLKTYLRAATDALARPWVHSAFVDNAGIVAFTDEWDLAIKVETHNHPSALDPFGGANTGVGGVVRDVMAVSARPIANTDVLCFGPLDTPATALPAGTRHPRRIHDGVIAGIEDYGNKMGIPTVGGAIVFHRGFTANPLVFCGCVGVLPAGERTTQHTPHAHAGDLIVAIGGRTGRDGLRGATFSSMEMDTSTSLVAGSAVQIGHPIHEKQTLEALLAAHAQGLYRALTDCGAGGFSSAIGEMAYGLGAEVQLRYVPLKYPGLRPWEIWLSEAQERMVLAVSPEHWAGLKAICDGHDIEAVQLGRFSASGRLVLRLDQRVVGDLDVHFLHDGIPERHLLARSMPPLSDACLGILPVAPAQAQDLTPSLLALLAHPNLRSREAVIRRYDHEVQGGSVVRALAGAADHGPSDAAVITPINAIATSTRGHSTLPGAAIAHGICPQYGERDPYAMAFAAIDEAVRNAVAAGADPDRIAILDNFCWGNPLLTDRLAALVECVRGCHDAALRYGTPFVSGKDSLNNEYTDSSGERHAIPGTLLITALGFVPDITHTVTLDLKAAGDVLYVLGDTRAELGAAHYRSLANGSAAQTVPQPVAEPLQRLRALHTAIKRGWVVACHDCSEGGLGVALAEMALAGRIGASVSLEHLPRAQDVSTNDVALFSESLCRFVIEVPEAHAAEFETLCAGLLCARIGQVGNKILSVQGLHDDRIIHATLPDLEVAWRGELAPSPPGPAAASEQRIRNDASAQSENAGIESGTRSGTVRDPSALSSAAQPANPAGAQATQPIAPSLDISSSPADTRTPPLTEVRMTVPALTRSSKRVLILHASGSNRDHDAALAVTLAGGWPEIVHIHQIITGERRIDDAHMLIAPGGFSYGDAMGAGVLWALDLRERLGEAMGAFVASGRPVIGICNGFQALIKASVFEGVGVDERSATLTYNAREQFECRWVQLMPNPNSICLFTRGLEQPIDCPVAHGEGRFTVHDDQVLTTLERGGRIALTYAGVAYPHNPNGSAGNVAGICNAAGNVLGLMPHPENHIFPWQFPRWRRGERGGLGLALFANALRFS